MSKLGVSKKRRRNQLSYPVELYYHNKQGRTAIRILKILAKHNPRGLSIKEIAENLGSVRSSYSHVRTKIILQDCAKLDYCDEYTKVTNSNTRCRHCGMSSRYIVKKSLLKQSVKIQERDNKEYSEHKTDPNFDKSCKFICDSGFVLGKSITYLDCFQCGKTNVNHGLETKYKIDQQKRYWKLSDNGMVIALAIQDSDELSKFYLANPTNKIIECINSLNEIGQHEWVEVLISKLRFHIESTPSLLKLAEEWVEEQHYKHDIFRNLRTYDSPRSNLLG